MRLTAYQIVPVASGSQLPGGLVAYAKEHGIPVETCDGGADYSMDANMLHISYEGGELEDPWIAPDGLRGVGQCRHRRLLTRRIYRTDLRGGDPVANGESLSPAQMLEALNQLGRVTESAGSTLWKTAMSA